LDNIVLHGLSLSRQKPPIKKYLFDFIDWTILGTGPALAEAMSPKVSLPPPQPDVPRQAASLRREIVLILVLKLALIVTLKLVFFSNAVKPDSDRVAAALLAAPTAAAMSPIPATRSSAPVRSPAHE
jgi:hypothetical protein